jgi:hypothetical protein
MSSTSGTKYAHIYPTEDEPTCSQTPPLTLDRGPKPPPDKMEDSFEPQSNEDDSDPQVYLAEAKRLHSLGLHPHTAFAGMMNLCYDAITPHVLQQFIEYGLNIDAEYCAYPNDTHNKVKPIISALEYRQVELVQVLSEAGTSVSDKCSINSAVNVALCGHSGDDQDDWETCEILIRILDAKSAPKQITKWVRDDCCDVYLEKSQYLRDYINSCEVCDTT